jgi:hypothetical protein
MPRLALLLVLLCGCASVPSETVFLPAARAGLKVVHVFDLPGRGTLVEYLPAEEQVDSWRHMLTIQFLEGERRSPETVVAELEEAAGRHGGTLEWKVLERDANSVLYEWSLLDCPRKGAPYQDQCELARLLRGNDGLHRVAYTERARSMDRAKREHYLGVFRAATVVKGPDREPVVLVP